MEGEKEHNPLSSPAVAAAISTKKSAPAAEDTQRKLAPVFLSPAVDKYKGSVIEQKTPKRKRVDSANSKEDPTRGRTPSGQVLSGKVSGIKDFFSSSPLNKKGHTPFKFPTETVKQSKQDVTDLSVNSAQSTASCSLQIFEDAALNQSSKVFVNTLDVSSGFLRTATKHCSNNMSNMQAELQQQESALKNAILQSEAELGERDINVADGNNSSPMLNKSTTQMEQNKEVVDVRMVLGMFQDLKTELGNVKKDLNALAATGNVSMESKTRFMTVEKAVEGYEIESAENTRRWALQGFRQDILIGSLQRMNDRLNETQKRVERLETVNAKRMLIMTGFFADAERKNARQQLLAFFRDTMGIQDMQLDDFYMMGNSIPPNIVLTFQTVQQRASVFQNIGKIKNFVNKDGNKIIFRDYQTPEQSEQKKRQYDMNKDNRSRHPDLQAEIEFKGKVPYVNGAACPNPIQAPDPMEVIHMTMLELNEIMATPINTTAKFMKLGNEMIGASIPAKDFATIRKAYMCLRLKYPAARHIVAAWNIYQLSSNMMDKIIVRMMSRVLGNQFLDLLV